MKVVIYAGNSKTADMIEAYAKVNNLKVIDTIINEMDAIQKLMWFIEREKVQAVLVSSGFDLTMNKEQLRKFLEFAADHNVTVNSREYNWMPVRIESDD